MALPPLEVFVGIVAADASRLLDSLDALGIRDRGLRLRLHTNALSIRCSERGENTVPHATEAEVVVERLPGREVVGKISPVTSCAKEIEDGVENLAMWVSRSSPAGHSRRQVALQAFPFHAREVGGVHDAHGRERTQSPVLSHHQTRSYTISVRKISVMQLNGNVKGNTQGI